MFAYLKGTLAVTNQEDVVLEVGGIGYRLFISSRLYSELPPLGEETKFFVSYVVREFSHSLYGFLRQEEKDLFEVLMDISGVGPKLALSLIGNLTVAEMYHAVSGSHLNVLCKVPGVGKKTAERLALELKDKLPKFMHESFTHHAIPMTLDPKAAQIQDAMSALIHLGYNQGAAQKAVKQTLKDQPDISELSILITSSLKHLKSS